MKRRAAVKQVTPAEQEERQARFRACPILVYGIVLFTIYALAGKL